VASVSVGLVERAADALRHALGIGPVLSKARDAEPSSNKRPGADVAEPFVGREIREADPSTKLRTG
jgi:hypothetical protein